MIQRRRTTPQLHSAPTADQPKVAAISSAPGSLYVVATPIGNLSDLSQRAIDCLGHVNWVAAEDTRVTRTLLNHIGSKAQLFALHAHNEDKVSADLIKRLCAGERGALVSDAGTPAISDPGAVLVAAAHSAGITVTPIPGASAPIALLSAAGLMPGPFLFEGFLPAREKLRKQRLSSLKTWSDSARAHLVLFEAPHRIGECVADLLELFGPAREIVLGRELTKVFEEVHRCALADAPNWLAANPNRSRGEFVLAVAATAPPTAGEQADAELDADAIDVMTHPIGVAELLRTLLAELPLSQAVKLTQKLTGQAHRTLYQYALEISRIEKT